MACRASEFSLSLRLDAPIPLQADLHCSGGELLALVGSSGSGKSTLLRLIAGLARPAQGRIHYDKVCWFDSARGIHLSPQQRRIGFVPQYYGLFPHMSALGNVMAGLHDLPRRKRESLARHWMDKVKLQGLDSRRPAELSGGQQQRVAIARALVREPLMLLLDEPFSAVDRVTRETLHIELAELKRELSLPIVMVTHDLDEALLLADRMTLLSDGCTIQSGIPREVMARPISAAAARQLGHRNLFEGRVVRREAETGLTWIRSGEIELACPSQVESRVGSEVIWMIPAHGVRLRALTSGQLPVSRNKVRITVRSVISLGDQCFVTAQLPGLASVLSLHVPTQLSEGLGLRPGIQTDVVLREEQIHVVPTGQAILRSSGAESGAQHPPR